MGDNGQPMFKDLEAPLWAKGAYRIEKKGEYEYQPLVVKRGTLVLFHGNLMHMSGVNKSAKSRTAYSFSIIDDNVECPDDSYMKPEEGNFESL